MLLNAVDAAEAQAEVIDVAPQHAPDGAALRAAGQGLHRRRRLAVVGGRRMARQHDAIRRKIGSQAPGVLSFSGGHLAGSFGRPSDARRLAQFGAQFLAKIDVGGGIRRAHARLEDFGAGMGQRGVAFAQQLVVEALADHGPIAQVVGDAPNEFHDAGTQLGNLAGRRPKEAFRGFAGFAGQHHQELAAAARTQQDTRQPQFRQQRPRQHFAEQGNPLRASGEKIFAVPRGHPTCGTSFGGWGQKERFRAENFAFKQDLFGHRTGQALRNPNFSTES